MGESGPFKPGDGILVAVHGLELGKQDALLERIYLDPSGQPLVERRRDGAYYVSTAPNVWLNDEPHRGEARLKDGDILRVGDQAWRYLLKSSLETPYHAAIFRLATTDASTGLYNQRYLVESLTREIRSAERYNRPLSLAMVQIQVDTVESTQRGLRDFVQTFQEGIRKIDFLALWRDEIIATVLPDLDWGAAKGQLMKLCAPLRDAWAIGLVERAEMELQTHQEFLTQAEARLQLARDLGGNRIE